MVLVRESDSGPRWPSSIDRTARTGRCPRASSTRARGTTSPRCGRPSRRPASTASSALPSGTVAMPWRVCPSGSATGARPSASRCRASRTRRSTRSGGCGARPPRTSSPTRTTGSLVDVALALPDTRATVVLRHAEAMKRVVWQQSGDPLADTDSARPLNDSGVHHAYDLVGILGAYAPRFAVSSDARRCRATLEPFAAHAHLSVHLEHAAQRGGLGRRPHCHDGRCRRTARGPRPRRLVHAPTGAPDRARGRGRVLGLRRRRSPYAAGLDPRLHPGAGIVLHRDARAGSSRSTGSSPDPAGRRSSRRTTHLYGRRSPVVHPRPPGRSTLLPSVTDVSTVSHLLEDQGVHHGEDAPRRRRHRRHVPARRLRLGRWLVGRHLRERLEQHRLRHRLDQGLRLQRPEERDGRVDQGLPGRCSGATINYQATAPAPGIQDFINKQTVVRRLRLRAQGRTSRPQADARCTAGQAIDLPMVGGADRDRPTTSPGVDKLILTPDVLAGIFNSKITKWNDPAIAGSTRREAAGRHDRSSSTARRVRHHRQLHQVPARPPRPTVDVRGRQGLDRAQAARAPRAPTASPRR